MIDYRCRKCNSLLFKEDIRKGEVEIKCPKCNTYNTISVDITNQTDYYEGNNS